MSSSDAPEELTLYSSRLGWLLVGAGFGAVAGFAVAGALQGGVVHGGIVFTGFLAVFVAVLRTQPWTATVTPDGVVRRCPLRRDAIPWARIDAFERLRRSRGLVVRLDTGKRRLICDRCEGFAEHAAIAAIVEAHQPGVAITRAPDISQRPTNLYRRGRSAEA